MSPWVPFLIGITGPVLIGFVLGLMAAHFLRVKERMRNNSSHDMSHVLRRIEDRLLTAETRIDDLFTLACGQSRMGLHVREVHGKEAKMAAAPAIRLLDVERVLLAVTPRKPDGTPDPTAQVTWTSSDPAQVGIEGLPEHEGKDAEGQTITIPATHEAWATTPLDRGTAIITAASPRYADDTVELTYEPGVPGSLNLSAGTPVPD